MNMRILFDFTPLQVPHVGGAREYCKAIINRMLTLNKFENVDAVYSRNLDIANVAEYMDRGIEMRSYSDHNELSRIINSYDRFYTASPYGFYDLSLDKHVQFIYTIHGLRDVEMSYDSTMFQYEKNVKTLVKCLLNFVNEDFLVNRAKDKFRRLINVTINQKIIVVSNHTKFSLISNLCGVDSEGISVFYSPCKDVLNEKQDLERDDFILMISGNRWMKNNLRAAIAIDELITEGKLARKIIITGVKKPQIYFAHLKNKEYFSLIDYVDDGELETLYARAALFLFPSLNEGFGYPPIEAMKYGTICISSAISSISEVCGDAVLYFNPKDIKEIKTRILECFDPDIREELQLKIPTHYKKILDKQKKDLDGLISIIVD